MNLAVFPRGGSSRAVKNLPVHDGGGQPLQGEELLPADQVAGAVSQLGASD